MAKNILGAEPHMGTLKFPGGQVAVIQAALNYQTVVAMFGRSFGKTMISPFLHIEEGGLCRGQVYQYAYCAPTYRFAKEQYRLWKRIFKSMLDSGRGITNGASDTDLILHLRPWRLNEGSECHFWGLDQHDLLRGYRKHRVDVDECKDVPEEAIFDTLMPMLLGRRGRMLMKGTPKRTGIGAAWFKREFYRGLDPLIPNIYSLRAPSHGNPYLTEEEIQMLIDACADEKSVLEEIYAEIIEDDASVFTNLSKVFSIKEFHQPEPNLWISENPDDGSEWKSEADRGRQPDRYVMGWDIGRSLTGDPSIATVFNERTRRQAALLRMPGLPFPQQLAKVHDLHSRYNGALIHYDETGIGKGFVDEMAMRYGERAIPHHWHSQAKEADITAARFLCSRAGNEDTGPGWYLMDIPWQRGEFDAYMVVTTTSKGVPLKQAKYTAPRKMHDDAVASACLVAKHLQLLYDSRVRVSRAPTPEMFTGEWLDAMVSKERKDKKRKRWTMGGWR